mmetsp:Transcript_64788/g.141129  ORF Transcript_64788/g.141129 Transcript_64788/m.141129 type:complete len:222 (-) Transcript_64788:1811-2476(-)
MRSGSAPAGGGNAFSSAPSSFALLSRLEVNALSSSPSSARRYGRKDSAAMPAGPTKGRVTSEGKAPWNARSRPRRPGSTNETTSLAGFWLPPPSRRKPPAPAMAGSVGTVEARKHASKQRTSCKAASRSALSPRSLAANLSGDASPPSRPPHLETRFPRRFCKSVCCCAKFCAAVEAATRASQSTCWLSAALARSPAALVTMASSTGRIAFGAALQTPMAA